MHSSHSESEPRKPKTGLPQQYSVFYAMGLAMILQGLLSAVFHVCPSNLSLQFDTTMMYLIMTLVFVKLYQFRHPDSTMDAYTCMFTLCLTLIFEVGEKLNLAQRGSAQPGRLEALIMR